MKKLSRKVFITIFVIISTFLLLGIIIYNVTIYQREYSNVYRNINFINQFSPMNNKIPNSDITRPNNNIDNMMIMDYEVYTVKLENKSITKIIGHNVNQSDFDIKSIVNKIIDNENVIKIGNLYTSKYAYNYKIKDTIVIMNMSSINTKLDKVLLNSILCLMILEVIIYFISKMITKWITKPTFKE